MAKVSVSLFLRQPARVRAALYAAVTKLSGTFIENCR